MTETTKSKILVLLASRKFWAAIIGLVIIIIKAFKPDFPVSEEQITSIIYILMAYILGTAIADHGESIGNIQ